MKKVLSFVLALCMICTLLPATALTAIAADTEVVFELGDNGSATHKDGSTAKTTYTETVGDYTLNLTGGTKMYPASYDAKGNSCIKLGTGSAAGKFSIAVPSDVTSVIIAIGKYKTNTSKVTINGTTYTLTKNSNDGAYDAITIDTSSNKTISLTTVSGGYRAMVNSITYVVEATGDADCTHTNTTVLPAQAPSCTEDGLKEGWRCTDCGYEEQEVDPKTGHDYEETVREATCTETGLKTEICSACGDTVETVIPTIAHSYEEGVCSVCGAAEPNEVEATLTFDDTSKRTEYTASIQIWEENGITATNNKASSTTNIADYSKPARFYANSSLTVESSEGNISEIVFDCNSTTYANTLKTSIGTVSGATVTVSSDKVTVEFNEAVESFTIAKLSGQVRMDGLTVTSVKAGDASCPHTNKETLPAEAPSCTEDGWKEGWRCTDCGYEEQEVDPKTGHNLVDGEKKDATCTETGLTAGQYCTQCDYTEQEVIPAGHNYVNGVCTGCGEELPNEATITFDDTSKRTEFTTSQQVWWENGITVTNEKGNANTIGDYANPVRFYKNSNLKIVYPAAMCQIVFDCNSGSYANAMAGAITGGTATVNSDKVIFVPETPAESFTFTLSEDQVRMDSITVICNVAEVDGTLYTSLEAALENTAGTLKLLTDLTAGEIDAKNLVVDLNGKTLTAGAIAGTVMDSTDGEGLVKVAKESAVLSSVDGQMLLWDNTNNASGYRAFNYTLSNLGMDANENEDKKDAAVSEQYNTTVKSFWSDINFTNAKAYTLVASKASGLKISFKLALNDGSSRTFEFSDETVGDWALAEESNDGTQNFCFYISVYGFDALGEGYELTVTPVINFAGTNTVEANATVYPEA